MTKKANTGTSSTGMQAGMAGAQVALALLHGHSQRAIARANQATAQAAAAAAGAVRDARNAVAARQGDLARWLASRNAGKRANALAKRQAALSGYAGRVAEAEAGNRLDRRLRAAEALGGATAAAAFAGVVGGVADTIASVTALQAERIEEQAARNANERAWALGEEGAAISEALVSQDVIGDMQDWDLTPEVLAQRQDQGNMLTDVLRSNANFRSIIQFGGDMINTARQEATGTTGTIAAVQPRSGLSAPAQVPMFSFPDLPELPTLGATTSPIRSGTVQSRPLGAGE